MEEKTDIAQKITAKNPAMIRINRLRKVYKLEDESVVALHGVSAEIQRGEICCIFGTSGSGKSTLLNHLAGMESLPPGRFLWEKQILQSSEKRIWFLSGESI